MFQPLTLAFTAELRLAIAGSYRVSSTRMRRLRDARQMVIAALIAGTPATAQGQLVPRAEYERLLPRLDGATGAADRPEARADPNSQQAHADLLAKARTGRIDVYFVGDSITRRWGALDYPEFLANWRQNFHGWNAANFGWGGDKTQHILWRLQNGELDGVNPKVIVVQAGTNNVGAMPGRADRVSDIVRGIEAIVAVCRQKAPAAAVVLTAIFPRNDNPALLPEIARINAAIAKLADGKAIRHLNINDRLADRDGTLVDGMSPDRLHLTVKGYQVWADALKPILRELLGPPATIDLAPPPTGDPSATRRVP